MLGIDLVELWGFCWHRVLSVLPPGRRDVSLGRHRPGDDRSPELGSRQNRFAVLTCGLDFPPVEPTPFSD